jgi:hypothetical protein
MLRKLLHTSEIDVEGRTYLVHYFESKTAHGGRRFNCEVIVNAGDRIIIDDDSLPNLQTKVARLAPATIYSRALVACPGHM